ncbi:DUF2181 domain-containing protein [Candidatus Parcubacteria bacterium]|nr:DUF2181 domain-containing protein [Candidatus Parcubacteria bacterium]
MEQNIKIGQKGYPKIFEADNLGAICWSHAVNSMEKLKKYLNNPEIDFLEFDIRLSTNGRIIAAHPPAMESNLPFEYILEQATNSKQGIKLDFKDPEILIPCLKMLAEANLEQPVMLNADILQGNKANIAKFNPVGFLVLCKKHYPQGLLSIGWTTTNNPDLRYTEENIDEMLELCKEVEGGNLTFPVRACLLPKSWEQLRRLLAEKPGSTLTVWNNEPVSEELADEIKENTDPERTFYDFIDSEGNPLRLI